ncbi:unnamed protein product [Auanema sp. JU1783]|nr:unnamed protein product [Auanema sp. JU1783]
MELTEERRRNMHKAAGAFVDGSRKRREVAVQIRRKKREEVLDEKRKLNMENCSSFHNISLEERQKLFKGSKSEILELLNKYNNNLSSDVSTVIGELLSARILARICEIAVSYEDECAFSAQKLLASFYAPSTTADTVSNPLIKCMCVIKQGMNLSSLNAIDAVELLQAISLFVENTYAFRNVFFLEDFLPCSLGLLNKYPNDLQVAESFVWLLSLLSRDLNRYLPPPEKLQEYVLVLKNGVESKNLDFKFGCIKILEIVASSGNDQAKIVENTGVVSDLLEIMESEEEESMVPLLSILCSVERVNDELPGEIFKRGLMKTLVSNMTSALMARDICYLLYSICENNREEAAQQAIDAGALQKLPRVLERMGFDCRREGVFFLSSVLLFTGPEVLDQIIQTNILRNLSDSLTVLDTELLNELLFIFQIVLGHGEKVTKEKHLEQNPVAVAFEEFGGRARLDYLVQRDLSMISVKAQRLIDEFLEIPEEQLYVL